tara:strand:+ start:205 stop:618 length:414 start_codon:yes stop_codon:yes gene_type:complete
MEILLRLPLIFNKVFINYYFIYVYIYMNKLIQTKFLADAVDCDTIWVKCSIPYCICPFRFHQYDSNGEWNGNRKVLEKSKCMCNYEDDIEIRITNDTKRTTLVDDKHKVLVYSKSVFKDKLKKLRKKQDLGKTENFH